MKVKQAEFCFYFSWYSFLLCKWGPNLMKGCPSYVSLRPSWPSFSYTLRPQLSLGHSSLNWVQLPMFFRQNPVLIPDSSDLPFSFELLFLGFGDHLSRDHKSWIFKFSCGSVVWMLLMPRMSQLYSCILIFMATYSNAIALLFVQGLSKFPLVLQNIKLEAS